MEERLTIPPTSLKVVITVEPQIAALIPAVAEYLGLMPGPITASLVSDVFEALVENMALEMSSEKPKGESEDAEGAIRRVLDPDITLGVEVTSAPNPVGALETLIAQFELLQQRFPQDPWIKNVLGKTEHQDLWKEALVEVRKGLDYSHWPQSATWALIERAFRLIRAKRMGH